MNTVIMRKLACVVFDGFFVYSKLHLWVEALCISLFKSDGVFQKYCHEDRASQLSEQ